VRCLLITKEYAPEPTSGGTLRTAALARALSQRFDLTIVAPGPAEAVSARDLVRLQNLSGTRTASASFRADLRRALEAQYDLAVIDHTALAALTGVVAPRARRVIVSMHNVESRLMADRAARTPYRGPRLAMALEARLLRRLEKRVAGRYPVLVCTTADAQYVESLGGTAIVGANGVSPAAAPGGSRRPRSVVFAGALDWEPNVEGLAWFVEQIWPRVRAQVPEASLTVAGRRPGRCVIGVCSAPGVRLVPDPTDMAGVFAAHVVGVVPLLTGGGSRIKILEYLAAGLDVVSTPLGAAGLSIPPSFCSLAPDAHSFASLLTDRLLEPRDVTGAPAWVVDRHAWPVTLAPLLEWVDREVVTCAASCGPSPIRVSPA
jgi:glycosyl transferase family 1/glycosyl transferase family 4